MTDVADIMGCRVNYVISIMVFLVKLRLFLVLLTTIISWDWSVICLAFFFSEGGFVYLFNTSSKRALVLALTSL